MNRISVTECFNRVREVFKPLVVARANGQELKIVKAMGQFPWHHHEAEDEIFLVWEGALEIQTRDATFHLSKGDCLVVPMGVEHRVVAHAECQLLLVEPVGVRNTGNVYDPAYTATMAVVEGLYR